MFVVYFFFFRNYRFIISSKHCLNSSWKITAFSRRGLSLYFGRRITTDLEERAYHRQSDPQSNAEYSSWLHLKFWVSALKELGDKGLLDFTLHFVTLPFQKHTSEWDEKTEESQILVSRQVRVLASQIKQVPWKRRLPIQLAYSSHTSYLIYSFSRNLLESLWYIIFEGPHFWTFSSKSH